MSRAAAAPALGALSKRTRAGHRRRVFEDGHWFDSEAEFRRYRELKLLERAGEISGLAVHPVYQLTVNSAEVCQFIPDFRYVAKGRGLQIEDVKSELTRRLPEYRIKRKLFEALYRGVKITEVVARRPRRKR